MNTARVVSIVAFAVISAAALVVLPCACGLGGFGRGWWPVCRTSKRAVFWAAAVAQAFVVGQLFAAWVYFVPCLWGRCDEFVDGGLSAPRNELWLFVWPVTMAVLLIPCLRCGEYGLVWSDDGAFAPVDRSERRARTPMACGLVCGPDAVYNCLAIARDAVVIAIIMGEGSFTGSAGRHYGLDEHDAAIGLFYWWYLLTNTAAAYVRNIAALLTRGRRFGTCDPTSALLYTFAFLAVHQYAVFTSLDYVESATLPSQTMWDALRKISTLGNEPRLPVPAEAISWALVEMFAYALVVCDIVYCARLLLMN
jgi:hypothetical protein